LSRIERIVFITGGVLLPTVTQSALAALNLNWPLDADFQLDLDGQEKKLTTGKISPQMYCRWIAQSAGDPVDSEALAANILKTTTLLPGTLPLIKDLSERVKLGLVSDYPGNWIRPILERTGLSVYFPNGPDLVVGDLGPDSDNATLFSALIDRNILTPGRSMWADHNSLRCMAAIRQGVDAGIFVDAQRFYRDLGLWSLVPFSKKASFLR
jgi:hypothetical protein